MQDNLTTARLFFEACENGKGWEVCKQYCHEDGTFSCQNEALKGLTALKDYPEFMVAIHKMMPDARYEILCFAEDKERHSVSASAVFKGTHSGCKNPGGV
jgi:predicted ester cyclase